MGLFALPGVTRTASGGSLSGMAREGVMGRWMHLAIAVATSAYLILGAADVFAQTWPGHPKKGSGSGVCRNQFSDPYNPNCGYEPPADAWCGPPRGPSTRLFR